MGELETKRVQRVSLIVGKRGANGKGELIHASRYN